MMHGIRQSFLVATELWQRLGRLYVKSDTFTLSQGAERLNGISDHRAQVQLIQAQFSLLTEKSGKSD